MLTISLETCEATTCCRPQLTLRRCIGVKARGLRSFKMQLKHPNNSYQFCVHDAGTEASGDAGRQQGAASGGPDHDQGPSKEPNIPQPVSPGHGCPVDGITGVGVGFSISWIGRASTSRTLPPWHPALGTSARQLQATSSNRLLSKETSLQVLCADRTLDGEGQVPGLEMRSKLSPIARSSYTATASVIRRPLPVWDQEGRGL